MIDLPNDADIVGMAKYEAETRFIIASDDGRGFIVKAQEVLAQTRNGKQALHVSGKSRAAALSLAGGDSIAVVGTNRKLLIFPSEQLPEMVRGRGVIMQKYKDGKLADIKSFNLKEGLTWRSGERERNETDLRTWRGDRAQTGKLPPNGFPKSNKFS
jgi:topoisomerase-4 subunit A